MLRALGLSEYNLKDVDGRLVGKSSGFFNHIADQPDVTMIDHIVTPTWQEKMILHYGVQIRPNLHHWRMASLMNPAAFRSRSRWLEEKLAAYDGNYDFIIQLHTLQAPGTRFRERPYVIITDNTYQMSRRYWPEWTPARGPNVHNQWIKQEKEVYNNALALLTYSDFARRSIIDDYDVSPDRVHTVGVGSRFIAQEIDPKKYQSKTALFVGYDFKRKGGLELLEAWKLVRQQIPDAKLQIVGVNTPVEDVDGVDWLGRISDHKQVQQLFKDAALFAMPSLFEPFGLVFIEAMGMGVPCVALNFGSTPEIIEHEKTGLLVEPKNVPALAEAIVYMLTHPEEAQRMGQIGQNYVSETYSWEAVGGRVMDKIHAALERE